MLLLVSPGYFSCFFGSGPDWPSVLPMLLLAPLLKALPHAAVPYTSVLFPAFTPCSPCLC